MIFLHNEIRISASLQKDKISTGDWNFGPRNFRPGLSAQCEMKMSVRVGHSHSYQNFALGRKFLRPKFLSIDKYNTCALNHTERCCDVQRFLENIIQIEGISIQFDVFA